jgi:hypothetical protein
MGYVLIKTLSNLLLYKGQLIISKHCAGHKPLTANVLFFDTYILYQAIKKPNFTLINYP